MKDYWEKEKVVLVKQYLTNKKGQKKAKQLVKSLNMMSDDIRDALIKLYMNKCKIEYNIKYLEWRVNQLKFVKKAINPEHLEQIKLLKKTLSQKHTMLFEGIDTLEESPKRKTVVLSPRNVHSPSGGKSPRKKQTLSKVNDPGPPPIFIFMPKCEELHRMIIKATQFDRVTDVHLLF